MSEKSPNYVSTTNACKLCRPLGAALAFRGIEATVPFLHGSQGCATYMRRYIISHFNEPIDIASSSLGEKQAVYGGAANLRQGLGNVTAKYRPELIGLATTCLTETIGDDVPGILHAYALESKGQGANIPAVVHVSTPSYAGTHMEGFHAAVRAVVEQMAGTEGGAGSINLLPGFVSPADLRLLHAICADFGIVATLLPDLSETMDGEAMRDYPLIPKGGTPLSAIRGMGGALASIELGRTQPAQSAGDYLARTFAVPCHRLGLPIGIKETDRFFAILGELSSRPIPARYAAARGRLIDALVDGHKYVFGKKAVIYGEEDLVVGLTAFLAEIGIVPQLCASGGKSGRLAREIAAVLEGLPVPMPEICEDTDFFDLGERVSALEPDLLIGHSKGYSMAREYNIPLIRVGFPIHDRLGGQRILHLGYEGALALFDLIANTLIAEKQESSTIGYSYM